MMNTLLRKAILVVIILSVVSCQQSNLSNEKIVELSKIGVTIEVAQDAFNKHKNHISITLLDRKGREINNKDIKIRVNNILAPLTVRQELYYTTTVRYFLENLPVKDKYIFDITLSDGKTYRLAAVKAIDQVKEDNIEYNKMGDLNKDFTIRWTDIKEIDTLAIQKSIKLKSSTPKEEMFEYSDEKQINIKNRAEYTIPKSYYTDRRSTISQLLLTFKVTKNGTTNPLLLKNSHLKISTSVEVVIPFQEK